jgi:hypothetical protein
MYICRGKLVFSCGKSFENSFSQILSFIPQKKMYKNRSQYIHRVAIYKNKSTKRSKKRGA